MYDFFVNCHIDTNNNFVRYLMLGLFENYTVCSENYIAYASPDCKPKSRVKRAVEYRVARAVR